MLDNEKILVFGGAFDPPHLGHTKLCQAAIDKIQPDKVYIIPNYNQPLKSTQAVTKPIDRFYMTELAFRDIENAKILDIEINKKIKGKTFTFKTIRYLISKNPNAHIYLLIGFDRIQDFKSWKNYTYIMDNTTLVGSRRSKKDVLLDTFSGIILDNYDPVEISSSHLRIEPQKEYLNPLVMKYIATKGIYCVNQIQPLMSKYRFTHTIRVKDTALKIAKHNHYSYPSKVYIAAMYHDVCKEFTKPKILSLINKYDSKKFPIWHTLHGLAAKSYIEKHFNIYDEEVLNAVANHVIPSNNMQILDKIIYLADKLEPKRTKSDIPNRRKLLKLAFKDINLAYQKVYELTQAKFNGENANDKK